MSMQGGDEMELGKQIKMHRQEAHLSQEELANRVYVSRQTISNWENDKSYPDVNSLVLLSEIFQISLDNLIKGDIEVMKDVIQKEEIEKMNRYGKSYTIMLIATAVSAVPLFMWLGVWAFIPWGIIWAISMYFLMALAHKIGEDKCTIFAQDISQRSNKMLKLNLILNSLVSSLDHAIQGDTLIAPYHKSDNGQELRTFDYVVSNPPFKMDFSDTRERIAAMPVRFWAGVPKVPAKKKESMAIYTLFIQHVLNSLKSTGKGAIVVPTGFVTAKSGVEKKILQHIVDEHIVYGCISMPSNVFANTGTNVSVLFFDNSRKTDKVVLIDASKLGEEYKDGNNQKRRLRDFEIDKIVDTFLNKEAVDDFSVAVTYDEIKEKKYSLAAGQYFDVKIEYVELSQDEFNARMSAYAEKLQEYFAEGDKLKTEIMEQLKKVKYE